MGATIKDIAKLVGVSPSTVSRVINGSAPISDEVKDKIYKAMKELNYHPNSRARTLVTGSTYTIALVVNADDDVTFSNTFFNRSVYAIERIAQKNGYNLLITNNMGKSSSSIKNLVYEQKVDGLVIPSSIVKKELVDLLEEEQTPWVILGEPEQNKEDYYWVDIDNFGGSCKAVQHLIEGGYKKIVYVSSGRDTVFSKRRIEGYRTGLQNNGYISTEDSIISCTTNYDELEKVVVNQITEGIADAYLCSNNVLAYHVMKAVKSTSENRLKDIGIVTFDNYPFAEYMDPALTVVDVDTYQLGEEAASLLIGRMKKNEIIERKVLIDTKMILRQSTKNKTAERNTNMMGIERSNT